MKDERSDPNDRWERARAEWDREVTRETSRAKLAKIALAVTIALHAGMLVAVSSAADEVVQSFLTLADVGLLVVTAVLFLRWLTCTVSLASSMSASRLRWTPSAAAWAFFMPIIGLWRPYQVLRDVHDLLGPEAIPNRPRDPCSTAPVVTATCP